MPLRSESTAMRWFWPIHLILLSLVLIGQLATGTSLEFSLWMSLLWLQFGVVFSRTKGVASVLGCCLLLFFIQHVGAAMVMKVLHWQPADEIMYVPIQTLQVYNVGFLGLILGSLFLDFLRIGKAKPLIVLKPTEDRLFILAVILLVISAVRWYAVNRFGVADEGGLYVGGVIGPLRQFHFIQYLPIVLGTAYAIVKSNGKKWLHWTNITSVLISIAGGIIFAVRQEMVWAVVTLVLSAHMFGFQFKFKQYGLIIGLALFFQLVLSPYALYARNEVRTGTQTERLTTMAKVFTEVITEPEKFRKKEVEDAQVVTEDERRTHYFREASNLKERHALINWVSSVIYRTNLEGYDGGGRIYHGWAMVIPRFANNPNKPVIGTANDLGQKAIGLVGPTDFTTQITLGFFADAFNAYGWWCVFLTAFLTLVAYGLFISLLFGDGLSRNILGLGIIYQATQVFAERTIAAQIVFLFQDLIVYAIFSAVIVFFANTMTRRTREAPYAYERPRGMGRVVSPDTRP
ncbi:hypothetical protein CCB81_01820 [Armatimonadetes bacterium Uphvl-Ar2]|jgi:hypothetical protein|nr:hypothetical protein CCB81_01820 [Armatimonadetes bacterium Uphvl-Ar2]